MGARPPAGIRAAPLGLALAAVTAVALWMVWPAFTPGRIVNMDAPRHLLRSVVVATQFLPSGHVDGWSPWWYLGAQLFLFQSYGYFLLIGASALLLSPLAGIGPVFKFWYVLPILLLPAATCLLALRLGVARRGAALAALASIIFSTPLGYGVQGVFGIGLLLQGAGVVAFAIAWPEILAVLLDRRRAPWLAVLLLAAVVLVHFISGAYALAASGCVAAAVSVRSRDPRPLLRYTIVAALVLLIAGHSLIPSLELRELAGASVGWGTDRERSIRFLAGTLFGGQPLALAALAAAAWSIWRGNRALAATAVVFFVTGLVGGTDAQAWEPGPLQRVLDVLVRPRALPYAALFQAVFAGLAFDRVLVACQWAGSRLGRPALSRAVPVLLVAALVVEVAPALLAQRRFVRTESMLARREHRVYLRLVEWLRTHVEPPAIVAVPRMLLPSSAIGARSVLSLLNLDTGLYTLAGDQAELTQRSRRASRVDLDTLDVHTVRNANMLRTAGVSYVILSDPGVRRQLAGSGEFKSVFEFERSAGPKRGRSRDKPDKPLGFTIYKLRGGGSWLKGEGITVRGMHHLPERNSWNVTVREGRKSMQAVAAINWHPNWQARVDGVRVPTRRSPARHVAFDVPPGARTVTLEFVRSVREKVYNALSAAVFVAVLAAWARDRRRAAGRASPERST